MSKGSAPATPDYTAAAQATAAGNLDAAKYATQANRVNQYTPWGSSTWSNDRQFNQSAYDQAMQQYQQQLGAYNSGSAQARVPGVASSTGGPSGPAPVAPNASDYYTGGDNWSQTISLSPAQQALLDQQNRLQQGLFSAQDAALGRVNDTMGQGFDTSTLAPAGSVYDPNLATNNATDLIMQRLNPQLDRQQESLRAQLANQGITQGSAAYNTAMNQFGQTRNDAQNQAALAGINLGMQQQGLQFNQSTTNRQNDLALQSYLRSLPLNELNALRTGNQVSMPQFPGFAQQATTGGPDLTSAAQNTYNAQLGAYNAQQAQGANTMGGLFGIGGNLLGAAGMAGGFGNLFGGGGLAGIATVPF